jgi:hypothetical protein
MMSGKWGKNGNAQKRKFEHEAFEIHNVLHNAAVRNCLRKIGKQQTAAFRNSDSLYRKEMRIFILILT